MVNEKQLAALRAMSGNRGTKPTCANGHTLPTTRNRQGRRKCKRCHAVYSRRWRNRRRKLVREILGLLAGYRAGELSAEGFAGRAAALQAEMDGRPDSEPLTRKEQSEKVYRLFDKSMALVPPEPPGAVERPTPLDMERESFQREAIERYAGPD